MKVAVTSLGKTLDHKAMGSFGRAPYFLLIETDAMSFEVLDNPNRGLEFGAGPRNAQLMSQKGVQAVLSGICKPKAYQALRTLGIEVILGIDGTVRQVVEQYEAGKLSPLGKQEELEYLKRRYSGFVSETLSGIRKRVQELQQELGER